MALNDILKGLDTQKQHIQSSLDKLQNETLTKTPDKPMKMTANQIAIMALKEQGLNNNQIAKELGLSTAYPHQITKRCENKYSLSNHIMLKSAHKAVKSLLKGEPFGSITEVKDSTSLQAAKMVYDRIEPLKTINESNNLHTFIEVKIDMEQYRMGKTVEVTPEL